MSGSIVGKPIRSLGGFYSVAGDTVAADVPAAVRVARVPASDLVRCAGVAVSTLMLAIPFTVLTVFTLNILLSELGAADLSGTGTALGTITQIGPVVTVLVVAGAGATAMCADLGARTIREELDAMRVMGINPIQALVVPRVLAVDPGRTAAVGAGQPRRAGRRIRLLGVRPARHPGGLRVGSNAAGRPARGVDLLCQGRGCSACPRA